MEVKITPQGFVQNSKVKKLGILTAYAVSVRRNGTSENRCIFAANPLQAKDGDNLAVYSVSYFKGVKHVLFGVKTENADLNNPHLFKTTVDQERLSLTHMVVNATGYMKDFEVVCSTILEFHNKKEEFLAKKAAEHARAVAVQEANRQKALEAAKEAKQKLVDWINNYKVEDHVSTNKGLFGKIISIDTLNYTVSIKIDGTKDKVAKNIPLTDIHHVADVTESIFADFDVVETAVSAPITNGNGNDLDRRLGLVKEAAVVVSEIKTGMSKRQLKKLSRQVAQCPVGNRMAIYTEAELKQIELDEAMAKKELEASYEDDIDYDEFDDYYDQQ